MTLQLFEACRYSLRPLVFCLCSLFSLPIFAQNSTPEEQREWARAVLNSVSRLESLQAAQSDLAEVGYNRQAADRPLYNPEIGADYVEKTNQEYNVSLSQTLDWSGKRSARSKAAQSELTSAEFGYSNVRNTVFANALHALAEYDLARQYSDLSQQQVALLQQLFELANRRFDAGDLGQIDVQLARLSLSEALHEAAQARQQMRIQQGLVESYAGLGTAVDLPAFPIADMPDTKAIDQLVENIPEVKAAQYQFIAVRDAVSIAESQRKADPTVSLGAGNEGNDSVVALSLSIPLYLRNSYSAEVRASNEAANAAELRYINLRRMKIAELSAVSDSYRRLSEDYKHWQEVTDQRLDESRDLLQLLWGTGDITTAEYVFGIQQNVAAVRGGVSFENDVFNALISWLETSGQVENWLESITQKSNTQ